MSRTLWLSLMLLVGCAHAADTPAENPIGHDQLTAKRIYMVAEERFAAGAYEEAAALLRHCVLQLPASSDHDRLRHQLVLRIAHTQLRDHAASGRTAPLHDAQQMLTRYVERHEQLFGEGEAARAERGEVYELLYEVELRLDPELEPELEPEPEPEPSEISLWAALGERLAEMAGVGDRPVPTATTPPAAPPPATDETSTHTPVARETSTHTPAARETSTHTPADGESESGQTREVVVHRRRLASLDDPRVREQLDSSFSAPEAGLVLTAPGIELVHGPRPLVRSTSRLAGPGDRRLHRLARRAGRSLVQGVREPLLGCYEAAFARETITALQSTVEASIHADGTVSHVRIVDGGLIDGYGDACIIEAMQRTTMEPLAEVDAPVRVELALLFFYESAVYIVEGTGEQLPAGGIMIRPNPYRPPGLPPIDEFAQ